MSFYDRAEMNDLLLRQITGIAEIYFSDPGGYIDARIPEKDQHHAMGTVYGLTLAGKMMHRISKELLPTQSEYVETSIPMHPDKITLFDLDLDQWEDLVREEADELMAGKELEE